MLEFQKPGIKDKEWVKECFGKNNIVDCEYCFGNLIIWSEIYKMEICHYKDFFISRSPDGDGGYSFCFPKGEGDYDEIISLIEKEYEKVSFFGLNSRDCKILKEIRKESYEISSDRDMFDYIYKVSDLAQLKGRRYHQKRNHIAFFENNYDWQYEKINDQNINECLLMNEEWEKDNKEKIKMGIASEEIAIKNAVKYYKELDFVGGLIRVDKKVVAYTFGERLSDNIFCTHFEKAFASIRGAYPMINREFARNELSSFEFVNREEDMGIEGLRKAKLSYHPYMMSEIFNAEKR